MANIKIVCIASLSLLCVQIVLFLAKKSKGEELNSPKCDENLNEQCIGQTELFSRRSLDDNGQVDMILEKRHKGHHGHSHHPFKHHGHSHHPFKHHGHQGRKGVTGGGVAA